MEVVVMRYVMLVLALLVIVACEADSEAAADPTDTPRPRVERRTVEYRVTTSFVDHDISLTYENAGGNTEQVETTVPERLWIKGMRVRPGAFAYVSVQNREDAGRVACQILVDGVVVEEAESQGAYVIATCSGTVR